MYGGSCQQRKQMVSVNFHYCMALWCNRYTSHSSADVHFTVVLSHAAVSLHLQTQTVAPSAFIITNPHPKLPLADYGLETLHGRRSIWLQFQTDIQYFICIKEQLPDQKTQHTLYHTAMFLKFIVRFFFKTLQLHVNHYIEVKPVLKLKMD